MTAMDKEVKEGTAATIDFDGLSNSKYLYSKIPLSLLRRSSKITNQNQFIKEDRMKF